MLLDILRPTQCGLRDVEQIEVMVEFVRSGGVFDLAELARHQNLPVSSKELIQIRHFEDENFFIHDGHHRCLSVWLAGREVLMESEYKVSDWLYSQYGDINLEAGFVTPYDPRKETRIADFFAFKQEVRNLAEDSIAKAMEFISENRNRYCEPRSCWHIKDLARTCPI